MTAKLYWRVKRNGKWTFIPVKNVRYRGNHSVGPYHLVPYEYGMMEEE